MEIPSEREVTHMKLSQLMIGVDAAYADGEMEIEGITCDSRRVKPGWAFVCIQGTAADIIKAAMIHVHETLKKECPQAKLILQVHDELIVDVPRDQAEKVKKILTDCMQNVLPLDVPLIAEADSGKNWLEAK